MVKITSAKRYAQAVFELALERNELESLKKGFDKIIELTKDEDLMLLLENPRLPFQAKKDILETKLGELNTLALNLIFLLIQRGRIRMFPKIFQEFNSILDTHYGIERAKVITAIPLDEDWKEMISRQLATFVNRKVLIDSKIDTEIIGGFIARIRDKLIDASIRQKLESLKRNLIEAS
jgi:F-type H+-transporting ATPase subunit delta